MPKALTDAHLREIGRIASEWSLLEFHMQLCIGALAGIENDALFVLTKGLSYTGWKECILALALRQSFGEAHEREARKLFNDLDALQLERNKAVHTAWMYEERFEGDPLKWVGGTTGTSAAGSAFPKRGRKSLIAVEMTIIDMAQIADRIIGARETLIELFFGRREQS